MFSVKLTWAPNPAPENVIEYRVYQGPNQDYPLLLGSTAIPEFVINDLAPGVYSWAVSAVNTAGEGPRSAFTSTPGLPSTPGAPSVELL